MNGKSMEDIESLYLQEENEKYINNTYGKEQWVQVAGKNVIHGADAEFYSGLGVCLLYTSDAADE